MRLERDHALLALLALALGACGLSWGLPARERLAPLLPPGWEKDEAFHERMAAGREELYARLEANARISVDYIEKAEVIRRGWTKPPERLVSSYRSFFLRSANPDEQKNLAYLAHMRPRQWSFEPFGPDYGGAYLYPLGAYYAVLAGARLIAASSDPRVYFRDVSRMARVFAAGRLFNALCFAGCALLLYELGRRPGGRACGFFAALLFLLSPVACLVEHTLNPYGWATLWFLAACLGLRAFLERGRRGPLLWAAAALGLCVGSSIAFWPAALGAAAPLLRAEGSRRGWGEAALWTAEAFALIGTVFVLTNPYWFLRFDRYADQLSYLMLNASFSPSWDRPWRFLADFLAPNAGWLAALLGLAGIALFLWRPEDSWERLAGILFAAGLLHLAPRTVDLAHGRHFLPFFALGALAAARLLWGALGRRRAALAWTLGAAALLDAGSVSASYLWNFSLEARGKSTRLEAARWIARNLPPGASVGLVAPPQPADTPPFRFDRYDLVLFAEPGQLKGLRLPDYVVASETRLDARLRGLIERRYEEAAGFGPRRLLPWVRPRGEYSLSNPRMMIYKRRGRAGRGL